MQLQELLKILFSSLDVYYYFPEHIAIKKSKHLIAEAKLHSHPTLNDYYSGIEVSITNRNSLERQTVVFYFESYRKDFFVVSDQRMSIFFDVSQGRNVPPDDELQQLIAKDIQAFVDLFID
tara:strand:- start:1114 stop:1476 length:363 start_codon:yes stop_codon:yes gene_type:complete